MIVTSDLFEANLMGKKDTTESHTLQMYLQTEHSSCFTNINLNQFESNLNGFDKTVTKL